MTGKQLHHIVRLNQFIKKYCSNKTYKECLKADNVEFLIDLKKCKLSLEEAKEMATKYDEDTNNYKNEVIDTLPEADNTCIELLNKAKYLILEKWFKEQLLKK